MRLEDVAVISMVNSVNDDIGASAGFDFFTVTGNIPTTGMLHYTTRLACSTAAMGAATVNTNGGIATFANPIGTDTVQSSGIVAYFCLITSATKQTPVTPTDVIFTGSVGLTTADITFNTNDWDAGDNVSITSLTFTQPFGTVGVPDV